MSQIHYFQRYSTKENAVTNTALHLFSQINAHSTDRLRELLVDLLDDQEIPLGVNINQQIRSATSVPDGVISQEPSHIVIETKVDAGIDADQLKRHLQSFKQGGTGNYLLLLAINDPIDAAVDPVHKAAQALGVTFKALTFETVCKSLKSSVHPHETQLNAIVEDFLLYCSDMQLLPDRRSWMRIVPCGQTLSLNAKWAVYYQPVDRGYSKHEFVGIYQQKAVRYVGKITCVFDYVSTDAAPFGTAILGACDANCLRRIQGIAAETKINPGWDISSGYRFFCVDKFVPTDFRKISPGGIQGARFYDVSDLVKGATPIDELAGTLRDKTWE
jgi:hypothetical protein